MLSAMSNPLRNPDVIQQQYICVHYVNTKSECVLLTCNDDLMITSVGSVAYTLFTSTTTGNLSAYTHTQY